MKKLGLNYEWLGFCETSIVFFFLIVIALYNYWSEIDTHVGD